MDQSLPILLDDLAALIGEIAPEQGPLPTPCPGFDVATLQQHVLGWLNAFAVTLSDPEDRPDLDPPSYRGPAQADAAACESALATLKSVVLPEYRGPGMPFGPEVVVADNAPALERLLAFTGRDPGRTPTLLASAAS